MSKSFSGTNVSPDLVWQITRPYNSYLVKGRGNGGTTFSRDPLNLLNKHSRTHAGFVNDKAIGIHAGVNGEITVVTKKQGVHHRPSVARNQITWGHGTSKPKIYKGISNQTAKHSYRSDLKQSAVGRASALRQAQVAKKDARQKKPRGAKASKIEK